MDDHLGLDLEGLRNATSEVVRGADQAAGNVVRLIKERKLGDEVTHQVGSATITLAQSVRSLAQIVDALTELLDGLLSQEPQEPQESQEPQE
jgi:hypothetical protein